MCINVACRADVAVPQPLLNLLQAHAIGIEQTGAAMAQIVKADTLHLVCDQKIREMLAQEIGPNPFSHRVYIDIVKIIGAIAFAADLPILLLLLFHFIEHLLTGRDYLTKSYYSPNRMTSNGWQWMGLPLMICICCNLILIADHDTPIRAAISKIFS